MFSRLLRPALAIAFLASSSSPLKADTESQAATRKPNFIFVLSDDVAQGDLGCYGQKLIQTPRLDRMAAEGTRFLQAYCGTSVCAPSRASFFTGLHTGHCPVRGNYEVPPEGQLPLPAETVTIAEVAKSAGYATATFGKWGMGFFDSSGSPLKQGVDHFFGYNCQRHAHSYFPTYLFHDAQSFVLPGNDGQTVGETYAQELIQNAMIRWLRKNGKQPFMMFYAITLPHGRHEIDDYGIYQDKPWTSKQKAYAAQVTRIDSDMGELVDTLKELGVAENTLIVFAGDNGSSFNPTSEIGKRFDQASNGLRGFKRGMYEGAMRQAALAWWPGTVPAGRVDAQPWAFWDLMPTFAELSGAEESLPEGYETDGHSLVDYFKGGNAPGRDYFYWELHRGNKPAQAARFGKWKAVRNGIDQPIEIYNLDADADESNDVATTHPDQVSKAKAIFQEAHRPDPNWPLDARTQSHTERAKKAWEIKRRRDAEKWVPPGATTLETILINSDNSTTLNSKADQAFHGRWAFSLPDGNPAWLKIESVESKLKGALLWSVGSARPLRDLEIQNGQLRFTRKLRWKPYGEEPTMTVTRPITGLLINGKLQLEVHHRPAADPNAPEKSFFLPGKQLPPIPPKPARDRLVLGDPIDLLQNGMKDWTLTNSKKKNGWRIENGVLINETPKTDFGAYGSFGNLRTRATFRDFELSIDYLVEAGGNSGIYLRGMYEAQVVDRDSRMQGIQGPGAIFGRIAPTKNASRPPGEWNRYKLTLAKQHITVSLNGEVVIDNQPLEGCTGGGILADDTQPGPIFLQGDHTSVRYRNILLRPVRPE